MIIISQDVIFEENKSWEWDEKNKKEVMCDLELEDHEKETNEINDSRNEPNIDANLEEKDISSISLEEKSSSSSEEKRSRKTQIWMQDYEIGEGL